VQPEPLLGAVADPRLQRLIDLGHESCGIGVPIAAPRQNQWREDSDPEVRAGEPLDAEREYVAVEAERQKGEGRGSHSWAAKKRHRDSVVHLLVGEQAQMHASMERRNRAPRGDGRCYEQQIEFVADRPGHDFRYSIDPSHAHSVLGWKPRERLDSGLAKTIDWYLANPTWLVPGTQLGRQGSRTADIVRAQS